jgi:hypothetical protein
MVSAPIWLDVEFARCAAYVARRFRLHALAWID